MAASTEKAARLRLLHEQPGVLLCGNAWDIGTARLIAHLGYPVVETSSAGLAFATGRPDAAGLIGRMEMLDSVAAIAAAVEVPVSADLENGFGDSPDAVAETVVLASARGIAGGSIEDATGRPDDPVYPYELALARIRAATVAARGRFLLTARCDAFMHGRADLDEVIRRLRGFEAAGADVLAAPGLPDKAAMQAVLAAVRRPVALFVGLSAWQPDLAELAELGVKRVSVGSGLARAALSGFLTAAREAKEQGTFTAVGQAVPFRELNALFRQLSGRDQAG
jgi:2-methylisocitrate lyase-like PEP mutase family enzyme